MKFKKILATLGATALLTGAGLMVAQSASAHDAYLSATAACNTVDGTATVSWKLSNDWSTIATVSHSTNPAIPDGTKIPVKSGNTNGSVTFTQTIPAPAGGVMASASYTATWPDHTVVSDINFTVTVSKDCTGPAKDASAAAAVTAATCTAPAILNLTGTNVTWTGTENHTTGPLEEYNSTATATSGHTFPDGTMTKGFSGALAGAIGYQNENPDAPCYKADPDASAAQTITAATCTAPAVLNLTGANVTWSGTATGTKGPGAYASTATAKAGHTYADGTTVLAFDGSLAGPIGHQSTNAKAPCYVAPVVPMTPTSSTTGLAETGSDVTPVLIGGIVVLVGGAAFAGFAAVRRRRSARV